MCLADIDVRELVRLEAIRVRVTPDPEQAKELERRRNALAYYPQEGFLLDRFEERKPKER